MKARWSRSATTLTSRVRGRSGQWMRIHVAPLRNDPSSTAVTIEPARPGDLTTVLLDSYGLTDREAEIVLHLCRGLATREIAAELMLSPHTIRDLIKSIFEKAAVSSRGELVAGLFANYVLEPFHSSVIEHRRAAV